MLSSIREYLPLIVWVLVIIAAIWVLKKSKRNDDGKWEQEDDNDNHIKDMDIDFDCESVKHLN